MENGIRCVVIGDTTLPQACADLLLEQGFTLSAMVTRDRRVAAWAVAHGISCVAQARDLPALLDGKPFDYLFSIINDQILGEELLAAPRKLAVNYHDAPLPRYAGMHATSWALLGREPMHGISWHVMTAQVDAGDLLRQEVFALEDNETALSLNTKCYGAALKAFASLLQDIAAGSVRRHPQDLGRRSYYGGTQRPPAACTLSRSATAEDMSALVRALQFGPYPNPLGLPKLYLGGNPGRKFVTFGMLDVLPTQSEKRPGTIVSCGPKALIVATTTQDVALQQFATLEGAPLALDALVMQEQLVPGMEIGHLDIGSAAHLSELHQRLASHERYWAAKLERTVPTGLGALACATDKLVHAHVQELTTESVIDLSAWPAAAERAAIVLAGFAVYLARIERIASVHMGYLPARGKRRNDEFAELFSRTVPLHLEIDLRHGLIDAWRTVEEEMASTVKCGSYIRDIVQRYPALRERGAAAWNWPVQVRIDQIGDNDEPMPVLETGCLLELTISSDGRTCRWRFNAGHVQAPQVQTLAMHFHGLLDTMVREPQRPVGGIPLLREHEARRLYATWNATATPYPREATIASLFDRQAAATPHATALIFEGGHWSYAELERRAHRLAQRLAQAGVGPDTLVGLCSERSPDTIAALLAIAKAGGAYLPLDPTLPQARLRYLVDDARPVLLLHQRRHQALVAELGSAVAALCLDDLDSLDDLGVADGFGRLGASLPASGNGEIRPAAAANLAYAIYTSGSTGQPKGVVVTQQNVVRLVRESNYFNIAPGQRMLQLAPLSFDASTFEIWGCLLNGATLAIAPPGNVGVEQIGHAILTQHVHTLWLTAALFNQMVEHQLPQLLTACHVLAGGEALSPVHVRRFMEGAIKQAQQDGRSPCRLTNGYGPTECTTFSCCYPLPEEEGRDAGSAEALQAGPGQSIPIGRPIANCRTYVLDDHLHPVPPGVVGELYIGGDGLARGYLGRPGMTAERFVPDPFGATGGRLYRSGDLARHLPDGRIDYVGRIDGQVKLRGFRIELGEIEAALYALGGLEHAVVLVREDAPGDRRLVAYLVPQAGAGLPEVEQIRLRLQRSLPEYMVPAHFVTLETLPLTVNGKLDRRALPAPAQGRGTRDYVAPRNPTEEALARIWADVLKIDRVGIHDNFFALGGHSLMATQAMSRSRSELGITLPLQTLFETLTVAALAERYDNVAGLLAPQTGEGEDGIEEFEF